MDSNIEFFSNVATATLADASTALGLNLIMDGPRPVVPESYPHFAGPAATLVFAPIQGPRKAPYSLYDVVDNIPEGAVAVVAAAGSPLGRLRQGIHNVSR